jgi:hypothetical protein
MSVTDKLKDLVNHFSEQQAEATKRLNEDIVKLQTDEKNTWLHDDYECLIGQLSVYECVIDKLERLINDCSREEE